MKPHFSTSLAPRFDGGAWAYLGDFRELVVVLLNLPWRPHRPLHHADIAEPYLAHLELHAGLLRYTTDHKHFRYERIAIHHQQSSPLCTSYVLGGGDQIRRSRNKPLSNHHMAMYPSGMARIVGDGASFALSYRSDMRQKNPIVPAHRRCARTSASLPRNVCLIDGISISPRFTAKYIKNIQHRFSLRLYHW
ncbi:hypothetical protein [Pseudomonas sp. H1_D04]